MKELKDLTRNELENEAFNYFQDIISDAPDVVVMRYVALHRGLKMENAIKDVVGNGCPSCGRKDCLKFKVQNLSGLDEE